jgi:hypothetical protein
MKGKHLLILSSLLALQAVSVFLGKVSAQTLSTDTLTWIWEVSSTVSTQTKTCVLEFGSDVQVDWGDGQVETFAKALSGETLTHVYAGVKDYSCRVLGTDIAYFKADSKRLKALDPTRAPNLTYLSCSSNLLTALNVCKNRALTALYCSGNELSSLVLDSCKVLQTVTCSDNKLTALDVSMLPTLKKLTTHTNALRTLLIHSTGSLTFLSCSNCNLSTEALDTLFTNLPALTDVPTSKNLYVLNNPGSSYCNISVANAKKWNPDLIVTSSTFYLPTSTCSIGDSVELNVSLTNPLPVIAFELDVCFPNGFVLDSVRSCLTAARKGSHQLVVSQSPSNPMTYKFMAYSMSVKDVFKGSSGSILQVFGSMPDTVQQVAIVLKQAVLVDTATNAALVTATNGLLVMEPAYMLGDANGDKVVNVTDIVNLVAYINGKQPLCFDTLACDLDKNGKWNVVDITRMVVIVNSAITLSSSNVFASTQVEQTLHLFNEEVTSSGNHVFLRSAAAGTEQLELCMDNSEPVLACQVDIQLPSGVMLREADAALSVTRLNEHSVQLTKIGDAKYRLLMYSLKPDAAFKEDTGMLVRLPLQISEEVASGSYVVRMDQSVLTGAARTTIPSLHYDCLATIQGNLAQDPVLRVGSDAPGMLWIASTGCTQVEVFDVVGRSYYKNSKLEEAYTSTALPRGTYIVQVIQKNGRPLVKKVFVN